MEQFFLHFVCVAIVLCGEFYTTENIFVISENIYAHPLLFYLFILN